MIEYKEDGSVILSDPFGETLTITGTQAEIDAAIQDFFPPSLVPMYKVKKYLAIIDMLDSVDGILASIPGLSGKLAVIDWNTAPNLVVFSPLALSVVAVLNLTRDDYYTLVRAANALP